MQFSGPMWAAVSTLTNLQMLDLYNNKLSEPLPSDIDRMSALITLGLGSNLFNGSLPDRLGNLTRYPTCGCDGRHWQITGNSRCA